MGLTILCRDSHGVSTGDVSRFGTSEVFKGASLGIYVFLSPTLML